MSTSIQHLAKNIKTSFTHVSNDIAELQKDTKVSKKDIDQLFERLVRLELDQRRLINLLDRLEVLDEVKQKQVSERIIGCSNTREYHDEDCFIARLNDPEKQVVFSSPTEAEHKGYNECACIKL